MRIRLRHDCGKTLLLRPEQIGRRVRCPGCQATFLTTAAPADGPASRPSRAWQFWLGLAAVPVVLAAGSLLVVGPWPPSDVPSPPPAPPVVAAPPSDPDAQAWADACRADTPAAYAAYLKARPEGRHADEARKVLEARSWAEAGKKHTVEAYEQFLAAYPAGAFRAEAQARADSLRKVHVAHEENAAWDQAARAGTPEAYAAFLRDHPSGKHAPAARQAIEDIDWKAAESADRPEAFEAFLAKHRSGAYKGKALARLEDAHWHAAQVKNTPESYQAYLAAYPRGRYADIARADVARVRERHAWATAEKSKAADDYTAYLRDFPKGKHAAEARAALDRLLVDEFARARLNVAPAGSDGLARAAAYTRGPGVHPAVFMQIDGKPHWWVGVAPPAWRPAAVETTELVVVIGPEGRSVLSRHEFIGDDKKPAPSITRYRVTLPVRVVEARTGKLVAQQVFETTPRPVNAREPYNLTELSVPVEWSTVEAWLRPIVAPGS